jgi:peptidoglycan/xylan/chitin deacetylase (PgdA/CDA1 family)
MGDRTVSRNSVRILIGCLSVGAFPLAPTYALSIPQQSSVGAISKRVHMSRVPVLEFHDFVAERDKDSVWLDCTPAEFSQVLSSIDTHKLHPITLDQLYAHLANGAELPARAVVLTFDDNYQGFYNYAYQLLKARRYPFSMFVHTNYVGSLVGRPKMSWNTLQSLLKDGLVTIGAHTLSHPDLTGLSKANQEREIVECKKVLEEHLRIKVNYFAYPYGRNNATIRALVRKAGYKMAFTGINRPTEESPSIWAVNRYAQTVYRKALRDCGYLDESSRR